MYIPQSFSVTDKQKLHDFIEQHSFATLVSYNAGVPVASHLPLLLDREAGACGELIGHMARQNPQWQSADGQQVLAIFHGPHAYVSPTWYQAKNVVPTWNYVAVHVYGSLQLDNSRSRRLEIVRRYVETYESSMDSPWSLGQADDEFVDKLLDAIVGFRISVEKIEGKWKLNQNHDSQRRTSVIQVLREATRDNERRIAELMSETMDH